MPKFELLINRVPQGSVLSSFVYVTGDFKMPSQCVKKSEN